MWDAIIAGAGPAGSVTALLLARAGWRVALVDRVRVRVKLGEALAPGGRIALQRLGLAILGPPHRPVRGQLVAWSGPDLAATDFMASLHGSGWRLDRVAFDQALCAAAVAAGAMLIDGVVAAPVRVDGCWHCDHGPVGRWIVDATGRRAAVARALGARVERDRGQIAYYARWTPDQPLHQDRTLVEATSVGWWYGAVLPDGAVLAGLHLDRAGARTLGRDPAAWAAAYGATRHLRARLGDMGRDIHWFPPHDATGQATRPAFGDGWIAVGDAALAFDPIAGHGITHAITSAMAAAAALLGDAAARAAYADQLRHVRQHYLSEWRRVQAQRLTPVAAPGSAWSG